MKTKKQIKIIIRQIEELQRYASGLEDQIFELHMDLDQFERKPIVWRHAGSALYKFYWRSFGCIPQTVKYNGVKTSKQDILKRIHARAESEGWDATGPYGLWETQYDELKMYAILDQYVTA